MKPEERQTRSMLMQLFEREGIHPRHFLGQNFLIDLNIVEFIAAQAELDENDVALEIGAGTGGMTTYLAQNAGAVVSVEIDSTLVRLVRRVTEPYANVTVLNCDALKNKSTFAPEVIEVVQQKLAEAPGRRLKLVANLPYNVATPIISNLAASDLPWQKMVVTIQLELGQRMAAKPRRSHYGALSVWLQAQSRIRIIKRLPPSVFWPRPKVNSAVVRIARSAERESRIEDKRFFHEFVRRLFQQRRKLLRGMLTTMYKQADKAAIDAVLVELKLNPQSRAEELEVGTLVALSNRLRSVVA